MYSASSIWYALARDTDQPEPINQHIKQKDLLEYVIVHELAHLIEPTHSDRFVTILDEHYPTWREARAELNELPLTAVTWCDKLE